MLRCIDEERKTLEMVEGDFGQGLQIELDTESDETIDEQDCFVINVFNNVNGDLLVSKTYTDIQNATIDLELSKQESQRMPIGTYYYDLDWYQGEAFLGNIIAKAKWFVREKAGVVNES